MRKRSSWGPWIGSLLRESQLGCRLSSQRRSLLSYFVIGVGGRIGPAALIDWPIVVLTSWNIASDPALVSRATFPSAALRSFIMAPEGGSEGDDTEVLDPPSPRKSSPSWRKKNRDIMRLAALLLLGSAGALLAAWPGLLIRGRGRRRAREDDAAARLAVMAPPDGELR